MVRARGAAQLSAPDAEELTYRSPGLQLVLEKISSGGKVNILDLGPPLSANVDFFSNYSCRLYIGDWLQSLPLANGVWGSAAEFSPLVSEVLELPESEKFDAIFCWDIVNYLNPESIRQFSRCLMQHCRSDALCFFFVSTGKTMLAQPPRYRIIADDMLEFEPNDAGECSSPRFTQSKILELMPEFQAHRSFLLQNGRQEQILKVR